MNKNLFLRQLFESNSSSYSYLLADRTTSEAVLIDPVLETFDRDYKLIRELDLKLLFVCETHVHADHITSAAKFRASTGAKIIYSSNAGVKNADILLSDNVSINFGEFKIKGIQTPGHTNGCICYHLENILFTGDTMLIRANGRTDFQEGSSEELYNNIQKKIYSLPDETVLYPAHDYNGFTSSTVAEEKSHNEFIREHTSLNEFIESMNNLKLGMPAKIDIAVPANQLCGENTD